MDYNKFVQRRSYINDNLLPDEQVIYRTHYHRYNIFWPAIGVLIGLLIAPGGGGATVFGIIFLLFGVLGLVGWEVQFRNSEFAVTNKRIVAYMRGPFGRTTLDLDLAQIQSVEVSQGILGRRMEFGTLIVTGTGGTKAVFKTIAAPFEFRQGVQSALHQT